MKLNLNIRKGFTLIEIMVVVAIIGILTTILYVNFDDARKQARDKARMTSLKEMQLSIELYRSQYGRYPAQGCGLGTAFAGPGAASAGFCSESNYVTAFAAGTNFLPDFISTLPTDPKFESEAGRGYYYKTDADGTGYKLMAHNVVERLVVTSYGDDFAKCPASASPGCVGAVPANTYAVYGGSGANW